MIGYYQIFPKYSNGIAFLSFAAKEIPKLIRAGILDCIFDVLRPQDIKIGSKKAPSSSEASDLVSNLVVSRMLKLLRFLGPRYREKMIEIGISNQLSATLPLLDSQTKLELIQTVSALRLNEGSPSDATATLSPSLSTLKDLVQSFSTNADGVTKLRTLNSIKTEISKQSS